MTDQRRLHRSAMELLDRAMDARRQNDGSEVRSLYRQACELETQAAMSLADQLEEEPTRSVLFRSAATLALQSELPAYAAYLAARGLEGTPPTDIRDELRELLRSIDPETVIGTASTGRGADPDRWERFLSADSEVEMALDDLQRTLSECKLIAGDLSISRIQRVLQATRGGLCRYTPRADFSLTLFGVSPDTAETWVSIEREGDVSTASWDQAAKHFFNDDGLDTIVQQGSFFAGSTKELVGKGVVSEDTATQLLNIGIHGVSVWPVFTFDIRSAERLPWLALVGLTSDPTVFADDLARRLLRHSVSLLELVIAIGLRDETLAKPEQRPRGDEPRTS